MFIRGLSLTLSVIFISAFALVAIVATIATIVSSVIIAIRIIVPASISVLLRRFVSAGLILII
jgi:hypothetical protein